MHSDRRVGCNGMHNEGNIAHIIELCLIIAIRYLELVQPARTPLVSVLWTL